MQRVLIRKRDKGGVSRSCYGIDLAEISAAPLRHFVGVERNLVDVNAAPSKVVEGDDGSLFELFETTSDFVIT